MTDNIAVLDGYIDEVMAESTEHTLFLLVKPGTDFDTAFKAWDMDAQKWVRLNGWLRTVTRNPDQAPVGWRVVETSVEG